MKAVRNFLESLSEDDSSVADLSAALGMSIGAGYSRTLMARAFILR
jgi:hypothetical protein